MVVLVDKVVLATIQVSLVQVYQLNLPVVAVEAAICPLDLVVDLVAVEVVVKVFRAKLVDQQLVGDN
jgi:hypothetical protein